MKYLKFLERYKDYVFGDYVVLLYKEEEGPYSGSGLKFKVGEIYKLENIDIKDEYLYCISSLDKS